MKKIFAMLLTLGLLLSAGNALAAPARETQNMDVEVSPALQAAVDAVMCEAVQQEVKTHLYASFFDGETLTVYGDVYACDLEGESDLILLPEETVTWLHSCKMTLAPDLSAEEGYRVIRVDELSPQFRAGNIAFWQTADNTEYAYTLKLPADFVMAESDPRHTLWQTEGAEETLRVDVFENAGYDAMLEEYLGAPTGEVLLEEWEFGRFSTFGDDFYELYVAQEGAEFGYVLRLDFPAERQGEYLFYGEMIRNSFFVWGGALG